MSNFEANVKVNISGMSELDKLEQSLTRIKSVPIKLDVKSNGIKDLLSQLKEVQSVSKSIGNIKIGGIKAGGDITSSATKDFKNLQSLYKSFNNTKIKISSLDTSKDTEQISALEKRLSGLKKQFENSFSSIGVKNLSSSEISALTQNLHEMEGALSLIRAKGQDALNFKTSNLSSQLKEMAQSAKELGDYDGAVKLQKKVEQLQNSFSSLDKTDINFDKKFSAAQKEAGKLASTISRMSNEVSEVDAQVASNKMLKWCNDNSRAGKETINTVKNLAIQMQNVNTLGKKQDIEKQYKNITSAAQASGKVGLSALDNLKRGASRIGEFVGVYGIIQEVVQVAKRMAGAVLDVDTAMTELRKVSDAPSSQITSYFDQATVSAKKYGATISDVITSTSDWSRLGYNLKDSAKLSEVSTLYKNVGDGIDIESANNSLISTLKGFHLEADSAESIIDKFNQVSNNYAISSGDIGEALQRSASALSTGNNDLSESIALITTAQTVVQNAESVGTGLKTASLRLRGTEIADMEKMGEDTDGMVESVSKLRDDLEFLTGVDIQLNEDTYKSTYQILKEISDVWSGISDMNQANALELMFGKRQANIGAAILENGDLLQQVYNSSEFESDGSASAENEKYMNSLQAKIGTLKATAQEFSNTAFDSDIFKGAIDGATVLLDVLTQIVGLGNGAGLVGILGGGIGIASFVKNLD